MITGHAESVAIVIGEYRPVEGVTLAHYHSGSTKVLIPDLDNGEWGNVTRIGGREGDYVFDHGITLL